MEHLLNIDMATYRAVIAAKKLQLVSEKTLAIL